MTLPLPWGTSKFVLAHHASKNKDIQNDVLDVAHGLFHIANKFFHVAHRLFHVANKFFHASHRLFHVAN
jgi:hypothetical protein